MIVDGRSVRAEALTEEFLVLGLGLLPGFVATSGAGFAPFPGGAG